MSRLWLLGVIALVLVLAPVVAFGQDDPATAPKPEPKREHRMRGPGEGPPPKLQLTDAQKAELKPQIEALEAAVKALKAKAAEVVGGDEMAARMVVMHAIGRVLRGDGPPPPPPGGERPKPRDWRRRGGEAPPAPPAQ